MIQEKLPQYDSTIMRKLVLTIVTSLMLSQTLTPARASLDAPINLENPRVVPIFGQQLGQISPVAGWSGYLYAQRIVFSAAHSHYRFDNNGNRILSEPEIITVGKPNSAASDTTGRVKVIKTFIGDFKLTSGGGVNDFIVYVLEKDLVPISKGNLLTPDIERELIADQAEVKIHGYGEYQDRCPGQPGLCKKTSFNDPKTRTSELPRSPTGSMKVVAPSSIPWLDGVQKNDLTNHILLSDNLACSGDSGGPTTAIHKGVPIYLGTSPNGMNVRACGAGRIDDPNRVLGYFSPVHKHLDLIKAAEDFIESNSATTSKTTITCSKGKLVKKITGANQKCPKGYKKK